MKKIELSLLAVTMSSAFLLAGGDLTPVVIYEEEDVVASQTIEPEPIVIPTPVVKQVEPIAVTPIPQADVSGFYTGLGVVATQYDTNCGCTSAKSGVDKTLGILVRGGYDFNQYLGAELRGIISNQKANGGKVKHIGAFAKPQYPLTNAMNLYGLAGVAKTTTQGDLRRTSVTGLAMGAGLEYDLSKDTKKDARYDREFDGIADQEKGFGLFMDYEKLYVKSGAPKLDSVSLGLTYDF